MLDAELRRHSIPWSNVTSFGCDNASVMKGMHKGVASFILNTSQNHIMSTQNLKTVCHVVCKDKELKHTCIELSDNDKTDKNCVCE